MKKALLLVIGLIVLTGFMTITASASEKVIKWRVQDIGGEADGSQWILLKNLKKLIEEGSEGKVVVEYFPAGTLTDPDSIVDAVANGAIEGGHIIAGMAAHRVPSSLGSEMPFGARDRYQLHEIHNLWGLDDIMREEYAKSNIYLLSTSHAGTIAFQSTTPINTLQDLKGKKIWCTPNTLWLSKFGASITEVPGFDMYTALKLGTIDGFTWTVLELEYFKFKEVVKFIMEPAVLTPAMHLIINMKDWKALGPDLQRKIQDHVDANKFKALDDVVKYDDIALKKAKEYGVKTITLPPAEVDKMMTEAKNFWDEVAGMSPHAKKMVETYRSWLKYRNLDW